MSGGHPSVAAVVPLYNGRAFILDALASIRAQSWPAVEIVVVDDGSSDEGAALVAEHCPEARLIRQENGGEAAARNRGIAEARSDFIALLDQDDLWHPRKLERQMALLLGPPALDWVLARQEIVPLQEPGADWVRPDFLGRPLPGYLPGCLLARRSAFERVGPFRTDIAIGSDTDWFFRAADAGLATAMHEEVLLTRRIHGANASRDAETYYAGLLRVVRDLMLRRRRGAAGGGA